MNKITRLIVLSLAITALQACNNFSIYPFYLEDDKVEMDELLGIWQEMDGRDSIPYNVEAIIDSLEEAGLNVNSWFSFLPHPFLELDSIYQPDKEGWFWMVEKNKNGGYLASHSNYTEIYTYQLQPFELDGNTYLDIYPETRENYDHIYSSHYIRTHSIARVHFKEDYALVEHLTIDLENAGLKMLYTDIKEMNKDLPDSLKITIPTENIIIDRTEQIQRVIRPYLIQDSAWFPELVLKIKK